MKNKNKFFKTNKKTNEDKKMATYKVEIFEYATGKTSSVIGSGMTENKAERRAMTGLSRCNDNYGTKIIDEITGDLL
jgi:hypothetical protein